MTAANTAVIAALIARAERRVLAPFIEADATAPERAVAFTPEDGMEGGRFRSLVRAGALREAAPGHWWLDQAAYDARRGSRKRVVLLLPLALLIVMAALIALS